MTRRAVDDDLLRELMITYQTGESSAFDELYGALAARLRAYLTALSRDSSLAEDLLQETFLSLHRARHTYDPSRPLLPWAYAIARHTYLMELRRRRRTPQAKDASVDLPAPAREVCPFTTGQVRSAIARLGHDHRDSVVLHHVWGFSFGEIAERLGITEGAARVRAHRATAALRRILGRPTA